MPPLALADLLQRPDYDVGDTGPNLLVASRAAVSLGARLAGQVPHPEVALYVLVPD